MSRHALAVVAGQPTRSSTPNQRSGSHCNIEDKQDLVDKLMSKRRMIIPLMKDAEDKQFTKPFVKDWLVGLKHTIYDVNSLLDRIDTVASHAAEQDNTSKIKEITKKLEEFVKEGKNWGLDSHNEENLHGQVPDDRITTSSWEDFDAVCSRNVAEDQIMNWVLSSPEKVKVDVIAIVGMGGLGKTTLAKFVYHHADVKAKFMRSWACVSDRFNLTRVTSSILEILTERPARRCRLDLLQRCLKKELRGKRFLIVLDDVWQRSGETWQKLMVPFRVGAPGSKVIVTTRDRNVASEVVNANHTYELKPMSKEEGLSLFSKVVTGNHDISWSPKLEAIGKKIVMKCGGLPLAIKTLGCLLRSDDYESVWENISDSSLWQLSDGRNDIVSALRLSYSHLPSHVKTCFAYCALFPQGHEFSEEELVNLWIDEGLLQQKYDDEHKKKDEHINKDAKSCFNDLASRSYFMKPNADVNVYVMHDVIHDLAQLLYEDFHLQLDGGRTSKDCKKVRHVSFHSRECNGCIDDEGLGEMRCLQTFLAHKMHPGWSLEDKILREFLLQQPSLRVLCLRGSRVSTIPKEISNLVLLRYLDVSYTDVDTLPDPLFKLHNLRRLLCDGCDFLEAFHYEMSGLHSLRRFTLSGKHLREVPQNLCQLRDCSVRLVFSLPLDVATAQANCDGSLLYVVVHINKSGFSYTEQNYEQNYDHFTRGDHSNLLESLHPHKDSKKVSIEYFNGRIPDWVVDRSYNNIHEVELSHCRLSSGSMPPLGQMPSLKSLSIRDIANMKILGREFYDCKDPFRFPPFSFLEELLFEDMKDWEEWVSDDDVAGGICFFRCLRNLKLVNCPSLNGRLPAQLPSLTELSIDGCSNLVTSCLADKRFLMFSLLQRLVLARCDSVERFPAEGFLPPSLTSFQITRFTELNRLDLQNLTSLESLNISHCPKLVALSVETLTRALEDLHLYENHPDLVEQCQRDYSNLCNIRTH